MAAAWFCVVVGRSGKTERVETFPRFAAARRVFHDAAGSVINDIEAFVLLSREPDASCRGGVVLASKSNGHRWVELNDGYYRGGKVRR